MSDEVTKKDLQSLQGYVNNKLSGIAKQIEQAGSASEQKEFNEFKRWVEGPLLKRINGLEDRIAKLEKSK